MGPVAGGLIEAGISGLGSLIGGERANRQRRREARRNRQFQERMRNTSWQAAVADMKAAGINPALAYSQGGAAAPSGNMAQVEDTVTPAVSTSLQARQMKKQLGLLDAQTKSANAAAAASTQQGIKTQREAHFQEMMNRLWGTFDGPGNFRAGPLWKQHEANSRLALANASARELDNVLLKNMSEVAGTDMGKLGTWVRYFLSAVKGR